MRNMTHPTGYSIVHEIVCGQLYFLYPNALQTSKNALQPNRLLLYLADTLSFPFFRFWAQEDLKNYFPMAKAFSALMEQR